MNELKTINHHAYGLIGRTEEAQDLVNFLEKKHKIYSLANPDFYRQDYITFTIDDARKLKSDHDTRPIISGGKKYFVICLESITIEAENALLKLLEEANEYAHFFFIIPSEHILLPTVRSRMCFLNKEKKDSVTSPQSAKFLRSSYLDRMDMVKEILDQLEEEQSKQIAIDFIDSIEQSLYSKNNVKSLKEKFVALDLCRKYISDRSPSVKMLLEYLALIL